MISGFGLEETRSISVRVGDVFDRLTVIATGQKPGTYRYTAVCQCECGSALKVVRFDALQSGATTSCGCLQKERTTTHGLSKSEHYDRWHHMMQRCYEPENPAYPDYGGRGIKVCDRWHDISAFVAELPPGYAPGLEMDRIENDGDYEPGNIQWSTREKNTWNRRSRRLLTLNGETKSVSKWAKERKVAITLITSRIDNFGWSVERAILEPPADRHENMIQAQSRRWNGHTKRAAPTPRIEKRFLFRGRNLTIREISDVTGITVALLRKRLCERKWPIDKATADAKAT